jgi:NADPH-dependent glutamate synthase beta subunit-like oxidoreductase
MKLGAPDASRRPRPEPIEGSEFKVDVDSVIAAIGQAPKVPEQFNIEIGRFGNVIVAEGDTFATSKEGIFAAGDAVSGPRTVIEAVAAGLKAADSIDRYCKTKR